MMISCNPQQLVGMCVLILLQFTSYIFITHADNNHKISTCKQNEILFMNKCWCEPGWESSSKEILQCDQPVLKHDDCLCEPDDKSRLFLKNNSWEHSKGYRCISLCRWNSQLGVPRSLPSEWKDNQLWKQLPFYVKDLPKKNHNHLI